MKTINRIKKTAKNLSRDFEWERKDNCHENMGDKYLREFDKFVGDIYAYSYFDRLAIVDIRRELFNVVT